MRIWTRLLTVVLVVTMTSCEAEEDGTAYTEEPLTRTEAVPLEIDARLEEIQQEVSVLQARFSNLPPDIQQQVAQTLSAIQAEQENLAWLRMDTVETREEAQQARLRLWEEYLDIKMLLIQARIEAATGPGELEDILSAELATIDREVEQLESLAADADSNMRQTYAQQSAQLQRSRRVLQEGLDLLRQAPEGEWEERKEDLLHGWRELDLSQG